jgi:hypothetical protein
MVCRHCNHPRHEHNKTGHCQRQLFQDGRCDCHNPEPSQRRWVGATRAEHRCLETDDIRESQNFVSEMARRYDGHR